MMEKVGYKYDAAGNLNQRTNNALVQTFGTDDLNQLEQVTRSGTLTVSGTTSAEATRVTVNGLLATRYGDETFARAGFALSSGDNTFTAIAAEGTRSSTNSVTVNLPSSVDFTYDANGNMTGDERRTFAYDDENQLIRVTVAGEWEVRFTYDGKMRKRTQQHYVWDGNSWELLNEKRYIYDGMLAIQERDQYNTPRVTYTRGRDLIGTLTGAGGIGGLLARTDNGQLMAGNGDPHAYYHADGNGNVTMLVNSSEIPVAKYHYDSYGNKISATGPLAEANTYRFSSKEYHVASGLYYYGYRFYDPNLQRWVNRDPLGELADINVYRFNYNSPLNFIDPDGESSFAISIPYWVWPKDPVSCGIAAGAIGFGIGTALCNAFPETMTKPGEWIGNLICPMSAPHGKGGRGDARKSPNSKKSDPRTREDGSGKQRRPSPGPQNHHRRQLLIRCAGNFQRNRQVRLCLQRMVTRLQYVMVDECKW